MKKQQKIIELRTAARQKVAEIETRLAFARSEAAGKRARLMWERAAELDGLEALSTERFDVLAKYRAKMACVNEQLAATVAQLKYEIQQTKSECERQCAAAEDDPEPENEQPQHETVYCDGSEHSARIVARRLLNKIPHIPEGGFLHVHIVEDSYGDSREYFVSVVYGTRLNNTGTIFASYNHSAESEAEFVGNARKLFDETQKSDNSRVAEPIAGALDAVFGGNPVEQADNIIADTVRKEGENE